MTCEDSVAQDFSSLHATTSFPHKMVKDVHCCVLAWSSESCLSSTSSCSELSAVPESLEESQLSEEVLSQTTKTTPEEDDLSLPNMGLPQQVAPERIEYVAVTRPYSAPATRPISPLQQKSSSYSLEGQDVNSNFSKNATMAGHNFHRRMYLSCSGLVNTPLPNVCINPFDFAVYDDPLAAPPLNIMGISNYRLKTSSSYASYSSYADELEVGMAAPTLGAHSFPFATNCHGPLSVPAAAALRLQSALDAQATNFAESLARQNPTCTTAVGSPELSPRCLSMLLHEDWDAEDTKGLHQEPAVPDRRTEITSAELEVAPQGAIAATPNVLSPSQPPWVCPPGRLAHTSISCHSSPDLSSMAAGWQDGQEQPQRKRNTARRASEGDIVAARGPAGAVARHQVQCEQLAGSCWPTSWLPSSRKMRPTAEKKMTLKGLLGMLGGPTLGTRSRTPPSQAM